MIGKSIIAPTFMAMVGVSVSSLLMSLESPLVSLCGWVLASQGKIISKWCFSIQIIDGCLQGLFIDAVRFQEILAAPLVCPQCPPSIVRWIQSLKISLPKAWMDSLTASTKAVKNDHAGIQIQVRDKQSALILLWGRSSTFSVFFS